VSEHAQTSPPAGAAGSSAGFWPRVAAALRLLVPLLPLPMLLGLMLGGRSAAIGATLGAFGSFMIAAGAGWRPATWITPTALLAAAFAGWQYQSTGWVVMLAAAGVVCGIAVTRGLLPQAALAGILIAVTPELESPAAVGQFLLFGLLGTAAGVLLARRAGIPAQRNGERLSSGAAAAFAIGIGATVTASALIATGWESQHAYWLPLMVFLMVMPSAGLTLHQRVGARMLGTLLGAVATAALIPLDLPAGLDLTVGFACLVLAFVYPKPLWLNAGLTAAAIILLLTAGSAESGTVASLDRIAATALGAGLLLAAAGLIVLLGRFVTPTAEEQQIAQAYRPPGTDEVPATAD
jgi:hypothetical protein